jgi:hypothetical protein
MKQQKILIFTYVNRLGHPVACGSMHLPLLSRVEHRFLPATDENIVVLPCCDGWSEYLQCVFQLAVLF